MPDRMLVHEQGWPEVEMLRLEGVYNCYRPVYFPQEFKSKALSLMNPSVPREKVSLPSHLDWKNLWPRWEEWFRRGIIGASGASTPDKPHR
jgi:hypothetical protein